MSKLAIFNMAISSSGGRVILSSVDDLTHEAEQCRLWYPDASKFVFGKTYWPTLPSQATLALVNERDFGADWTSANAPQPWRYTYALPAGVVKVQSLFDAKQGQRQEPLNAYPRFEQGLMPNGSPVLFTNVENAVARFSRLVDNPALWEVELRLAVTWQLAAFIAPALGGEVNTLSQIEARRKLYIDMCVEQQALKHEQQMVQETNTIVDSRQGYPGWDEKGNPNWRPYPEASS